MCSYTREFRMNSEDFEDEPDEFEDTISHNSKTESQKSHGTNKNE